MTKEEVIHFFPADPLPSFILTIGVYGLGIGFILLIIDVLRAGWGMHSIRGSIAGSSDSKYGESYFWFGIVSISAALIILFYGALQPSRQKEEVEIARIDWTQNVFLPYAMNSEVTKIAIKEYQLYGTGDVGLLLTNGKHYDVEFSSAFKYYETEDPNDKGYAMVRQLDLSEFPEESNVQRFQLPEVVSVHFAVPSNSSVTTENKKTGVIYIDKRRSN